MAAFMEVLDTSIANVALPYIAGSLGASNDDSTWVLTSYLVSNAIVLPISGWLAVTLWPQAIFHDLPRDLHREFTAVRDGAKLRIAAVISRACRARAAAGFSRWRKPFWPTPFRREKRGLAFALYGITAIVAPTIGPTLGGWITFNYSWRWIFFINLPVGMLTLALVFRLIEDPPYLSRLKAAGRKTRLYRHRFPGAGRRRLAGHAGQGPGGRLVRFAFHPDSGDCVGCMPGLAGDLGVVQQAPDHRGSALQKFQLPEFEPDDVHLRNPAVRQSGDDAPVSPDPVGIYGRAGGTGPLRRRFGLAVRHAYRRAAHNQNSRPATSSPSDGSCLAIAMYYSTWRIDLLISFSSATWLRVAQVVGLGFLFVPITLAAYIGMPAEKSNAVAGMVNFMRNMGSSVGTSMVTTLIARRSAISSVGSGQPHNAGKPELSELDRRLDPALHSLGIEPAGRAASRLRQRLFHGANTGCHSGIHRYVLDSGGWCGDHVLSVFSSEKE